MRQLAFALCMYPFCGDVAYELEPGLPTLYCAVHRSAVVKEAKAMKREMR
jgi:hypothetical protein